MFKFFSQWFYTTHDIHNEKEQPSGGFGTILTKKQTPSFSSKNL
jgi:hypothetical protein